MNSPILHALRDGTALQHERLDASLPLTRPDLDPATYVAVLAGTREIRIAADRAMTPWSSELAAFGYASVARREIEWLDEDLAWWRGRGVLPPDVDAVAVADIRSAAEAFGFVYVLEGSTLGARVILRHVEDSLSLIPPAGCRYFVSHAGQTGERWGATCASIERFAASVADEQRTDITERMVRAARDLFDTYDQTLNHIVT